LFYYRGNITVKGVVNKNVFIIVSRKNGLPISYNAKLADAVKALKKKPVVSDEAIARYEFFKATHGTEKLFINIALSTNKGNGVSTIELDAKEVQFASGKFVDEMITEILLTRKKNNNSVGIAGYSVYKTAKDAAKKKDPVFTQRYTKENCFKIENLNFGYRYKKAA
jgi:hypothetical protein